MAAAVGQEDELARLAKQPEQKKEEQPIILQPGQVVSGHEIVKPLGKGKFSVVYMAKRLSDSLLCALKKINIFDMMQPKQREKCLKEVRLLQSLDHPNIVKLLEAIVAQNELLIIVDWAEKGDLKKLIRKAQANGTNFKELQIWEYTKQLSGALDHMHKKRIMHRDLKPANIFIAQDGSLKLGDLGLGRVMSSFTLEAFSKVGTPLYMSPEVLTGAGYDMRSDVWSLGCVTYELAMLRSPFKSDQQLSLYDLFIRISKGQYPPLADGFSSEFRQFVTQMLRLEASTRPDAAQILAASAAHLKKLSSSNTAVAAAAAAAAPDGDTAATGAGGGRGGGVGGGAGGGGKSRREEENPRGKADDAHPSSSSTSRPSSLLVMEDIVEKLKLLDCEERLFRPRGYPILHRCFFVQEVPMPGQLTQFEVMYELIRWLLSLSREREELARRHSAAARAAASAPAAPDASAGPAVGAVPSASQAQASPHRQPHAGASPSAGDAAAGGFGPPRPPPAHSQVSAPESAKGVGVAGAAGSGKPPVAGGLVPRPPAAPCGGRAARVRPEEVGELTEDLMVELQGRGLAVHSDATRGQLRQGFGDTVCALINELINQELVGRDFHFERPLWTGASGGLDGGVEVPDEVGDEELASKAGSEAASEEASAAGIFGTGDPPSPSASSSPSPSRHAAAALGGGRLCEPILHTQVDPDEWRQEVERVRPKLKVAMPTSSDGFGCWRSTVETAKSLCRQISDLGPPEDIGRDLTACGSRSLGECERLQRHEDRLNARFSEAASELTVLRRSAGEETERLAALQSSVADLSQELASVVRDLDAAKDSSEARSEELHGQEPLLRLKQSLKRLKDEERQLALRAACVQHELLQRESRSCRRSSSGPTSLIFADAHDGGEDSGEDSVSHAR